MQGYLRRKVTYGLGKGGGRGSKSNTDSHGNGGKVGINPFTWLTAPAPNIDCKLVIIDYDGLITHIDREYRDLGEREGWLVFRGCVEYNGQVYLRYRMAVDGIICE